MAQFNDENKAEINRMISESFQRFTSGDVWSKLSVRVDGLEQTVK